MPNMANDWNASAAISTSRTTFTRFAIRRGTPTRSTTNFRTKNSRAATRSRATLMERDGFDALILCGSPNIYSHGSGVIWGCGLIDDRAAWRSTWCCRCKGEPTLIYPHPGLPHRGRAQDGVDPPTCAAASTATTAGRSPSA